MKKKNAGSSQDSQLTKAGSHHKGRESRKQIARTMKKRLAFLLAFLTTLLLFIFLGAGQAWWPKWMVLHQSRVEGIILLLIVSLIILSPLMIEASSNPRVLTGPGKNPKGPRLE